jgi:hypothetical protein
VASDAPQQNPFEKLLAVAREVSFDLAKALAAQVVVAEPEVP